MRNDKKSIDIDTGAVGLTEIETDIDEDRRSLLVGAAAFAGAATVASLSIPGSAIASDAGTTVRAGTIRAPKYYDRIDYYKKDDFGYKQKNYTYMSAKGPVVGLVSSLVCTIDRPSRDVWPFLKDFNSFEGPFGIRYVGADDELVVWGDLYSNEDHDLGQQTLHYAGAKNTWKSVPSKVLRVIPEHLLVLYETIPADGSSDGLSPGFHVVTLNEHEGKSHINMILEHAERLKYKTEEEALDNSRWGPKKYNYSESVARWKQFVPKLKELVYAASPRK